MLSEKGISLQLFLQVLEQYLFFTYKPTTNKVLVASNQEFYKNPKVANKVVELVGKPMWIYKKENDGTFTLLSKVISHRFGNIIGHTHRWATKVIKGSGVYRDLLYLKEFLLY